ncbi:MAG: zinc ribbon domain-containing protein [Pseudomonadota bacterium]
MFCGKCGSKIPPGTGLCPACGWQETIKRKAAIQIESPVFKPAKAPMGRSRTRRSAKPPGRLPTAAGFFTAGTFVAILFMSGAVLLFNHRGFAWEVWQKSDEARVENGKTANDNRQDDPVEQLRDELISISGQIAGMQEGEPHSAIKIKKRMNEIDDELRGHKNAPEYLKVYILHKSVSFQLRLSEEGEITIEVPPLPFSPLVPKPSHEYVNQDVGESDLLQGKILKAGGYDAIRYGPALFSFEDRGKKYSEMTLLDAPRNYTYVEVAIRVKGSVETVEYSVRMLDDFRRAYAAYLGAEKEARRKNMPKNHFMWRDVSKTEKDKVVYLHRIFAMPADSLKKPILEVKRQGASKMIWVQY